jgi:hypothetical protein
MRTLAKLMLALCLLFAFVSAASAQQVTAQSIQDWASHAQPSSALGTPDGVPPSGETICQGLTGAAHGLCTAYCEAMDCDSAAPQASPKACAKVAANYAKITGQGTLPCDCPCVTQAPGWIDAVNGPLVACVDGFFLFPTAVFLVPVDDSTGAPLAAVFPDNSGVCGLFPVGAPVSITAQQGQACINLLRQRAAAAGLTCNQ